MNSRILVITYDDMERLRGLLDATRSFHRDREYLALLEEELDRAEMVPAEAVPEDVVTMHSTVRVRELDTGKRTTYTLVFPREADFKRNRISVLAPIGTALLGYRAGDVVEWNMPAGGRRLLIESVDYQPEAVKQAA